MPEHPSQMCATPGRARAQSDAAAGWLGALLIPVTRDRAARVDTEIGRERLLGWVPPVWWEGAGPAVVPCWVCLVCPVFWTWALETHSG